MNLLKSAHKQSNLKNVMSFSLVSVDCRGYAYDRNFNQMPDPLGHCNHR